MRRIVVTVLIVSTLLMAGARPASAHTVAGTGATNFKTTLRSVAPAIPGLTVKVIESGSRLQASYTGAGELFVLGYQGEQYLRIDRRGVFENLKSPATYINRTRNGTDEPSTTDAKAPPQWHKISSGHIARWHDHRIHWMGGTNPPQVRATPGQRHVVIPDWTVTFTQGSTNAVAAGDLTWVPGPSPVPFMLLALALGGLIVLASKRMTKPFLAVALATAVLVVIDIVHSFAIGFANAGTVAQQFGRTLSSSTVSIPAWIVGVGAVWFLARKRVDGFFAAVFCGLIVAVIGGVADSSVLSRSQVPFALSSGLARLIVAASLGMGVGVAVASALAIRTLEPRVVGADDDD